MAPFARMILLHKVLLPWLSMHHHQHREYGLPRFFTGLMSDTVIMPQYPRLLSEADRVCRITPGMKRRRKDSQPQADQDISNIVGIYHAVVLEFITTINRSAGRRYWFEKYRKTDFLRWLSQGIGTATHKP